MNVMEEDFLKKIDTENGGHTKTYFELEGLKNDI